MKKMYLSMAYAQKALYAPLLMAVLSVASLVSVAQPRSYGIIYSDNIKGGATIFGNTLMHIINTDGSVNTTAMNDNAATGNSTYSNGSSAGVNMQPIDIDGNTGDGAGTKNSSSADLILPGGTNTIKMARLYWGGRVFSSSINISQPANRTVKIRKGTSGAYLEFAAIQVDTVTKNPNTANQFQLYQAYTDITSYVQQQGTGTYTVGNIAITSGVAGVAGNYGGWSIVVVYENDAVDYNSVRVYDGYQEVFNNGNPLATSFTLTGLDVPSGTLNDADAKMSVLSWEGDANFTQDYLKINGNTFSNAVNPANNPWNGTITRNGVHVTTKNPNYTNQMGVDIDEFNVGTGYGIAPNAKSVTLEFGTELDQYFPSVFAFVIKMKDPIANLSKSVTDASGNGSAEAGEVLTYKLTGINLGVGDATSIVVADTLPSNVTYVPGSLKVISSPGVATGSLTDAAGDDNAEYTVNGAVKAVHFRLGVGSNAAVGGSLASQETFEVEFQVTVNTPAPGESILPIINIARLSTKSQANVDYEDDGIAIINPEGGPLPVTLKAFTASLSGNNVLLKWVTSMELNCKGYEIERSTDGRLFTKVASVDGAGNSSRELSYSVNDNVMAVTGAVVYYRLKQVDFDGKASYSKIVPARLKKSSSDFTVSPNPFHSYVNINIDWSRNENATVKVFNMTGRELVSKSLQMIKGTNYVQIDEMAKLPAGNYVIQFNNGVDRIYKQVTKQ
ncbi:MAG: T9SS type A sorting domain-containing protein [Ferruginibacter sp.]